MRALVNIAGETPSLELREVEEPHPRPSEAVVSVRAISVNRGEIRLLAQRPDGWRPGQDTAGIVEQAAADGSGPEAGERVVAWVDQAGWAERVAAPTDRLAPLPDDVGFSEAAALPIAGVTALRALRAGGELLGRRVLVTGAAGGVGRFAVQLAAYGGAEITAVARNDARAQGLTELGARRVVHDIADAEGRFDVILECVGGSSLSAAARLVAPGGAVIVFGNPSDESSQISFWDFRGSPGARLEAFFVYSSRQPPTFGDDLRLLVRLTAEGALIPPIGLERSWNDWRAAMEAMGTRGVNGKVILKVD